MIGDDRESEVLDLSRRSEKLLDDATMLSAVVHDRLQTVVELGALPHDEAQFATVAERMRQVFEIGEVAVRSINETDFTACEKPKLDIASEDGFAVACGFFSRQRDSAFSVADLREFLVSQGADEATVAKRASALFAKWRTRINEIAKEQGVTAKWIGPAELGRSGKYALASIGTIDFRKPFEKDRESSILQSPVRLSDPDPEIWGGEDVVVEKSKTKPAAQPPKTARSTRKRAEKAPAKPTPEAAERAYAVVETLATLTSMSQRKNPQNIRTLVNSLQLLEGPVSEIEVRRAIRLLQRLNFVTKTPKRTNDLRVNLASKEIRAMVKTQEGCDALRDLIRSGKPFVPTQ